MRKPHRLVADDGSTETEVGGTDAGEDQSPSRLCCGRGSACWQLRGSPNDAITHRLETSRPTVLLWRNWFNHPNVKKWLVKHPRFHLHLIPTTPSWLNLVERWVGEITRTRIRRGVFTSVPELVAASDEFIRLNNKHPKPFVRTKTVDDILKKVTHVKPFLRHHTEMFLTGIYLIFWSLESIPFLWLLMAY